MRRHRSAAAAATTGRARPGEPRCIARRKGRGAGIPYRASSVPGWLTVCAGVERQYSGLLAGVRRPADPQAVTARVREMHLARPGLVDDLRFEFESDGIDVAQAQVDQGMSHRIAGMLREE